VSLRLLVRPVAWRDLAEQSEYIAGDSPSAALRLLDAARAAFDQLCENPRIGKLRHFRRSELAGVRSWPISGFEKYVIFYRASELHLEILRVLHAARDLTRILGPEE